MPNPQDGRPLPPGGGAEIRIPPHNDEAERSMLGAVFLDNRVLDEVSSVVSPESLYRESHRHIFRAMLTLHQRGEPIDVITLADLLHAEGLLEAVGGPNFLARLSNEVPSAANVGYYANIISRKSALRNFISTAHALIDECYNDVADFEGFMDDAESKLFAITQSGAQKTYQTMREVIKEAFSQIESLYQKAEQVTGVPSGFIDLDAITAGWQPSDLIILAARPAMGKCLSADSDVLLADGRVRTMRQLYEERQAQVVALNERLELEPAQVSDFIDDGVKPVFEVITRSGRRLEATAVHPLLTPQGWRPLHELSVGVPIAAPLELPFFGQDQAPEALVVLCARQLHHSLCTPALLTRGVTLRGLDSPTLAMLRQAATDALGLQATPLPDQDALHLQGEPEAWRRWLEPLTLWACAGPELHIPQRIFSLEPALLARFLREHLSAHGEPDPGPEHTHQLSHASERLARQLAHLLLRFGVQTHLVRDADQALWTLRLRADLTRPGWPAASPQTPTEPSSHGQGQIIWEPITSIKALGPRQVYDLTVPALHNFIAQDLCVHNTALTLNMASHAAIERKVPVAFFSLEMSNIQLAIRMLCSEARLDQSKLRTGRMSEQEWARLIKAAGVLSESKIFLDDTPALPIMEFRSKVRKLKAEHDIGIVFIDYLQLMKAPGRNIGSREQEISEISRNLKSIAKELSVPIIALAQLNRGVEQRADKRPMNSDLRESGAIEQDADIISFIYRDEVYNPESEDKGIAEFILGKHRNGGLGTVRLKFFGSFTRFENLAPDME